MFLKNGVFWELHRVTLVRTDGSVELGASFISVTRIGELSSYPDEGRAKFFQNVGCYKSHTA
jgi:hypothetical protein